MIFCQGVRQAEFSSVSKMYTHKCEAFMTGQLYKAQMTPPRAVPARWELWSHTTATWPSSPAPGEQGGRLGCPTPTRDPQPSPRHCVSPQAQWGSEGSVLLLPDQLQPTLTAAQVPSLLHTGTSHSHCTAETKPPRLSCTLDVVRKSVWTHTPTKPPHKHPLLQLHFQTARRTARGTWDDSGWQCQLKAPCSCQLLQAAFMNTQRRARGCAGHRAGGASVSPRAAGQRGTQPSQLHTNVWPGRLSLPTGFLKAWVTYLALIQKSNGEIKQLTKEKLSRHKQEY